MREMWIKRGELENYPLPESFDQLIRVFEDDSLGSSMCVGTGTNFCGNCSDFYILYCYI